MPSLIGVRQQQQNSEPTEIQDSVQSESSEINKIIRKSARKYFKVSSAHIHTRPTNNCITNPVCLKINGAVKESILSICRFSTRSSRMVNQCFAFTLPIDFVIGLRQCAQSWSTKCVQEIREAINQFNLMVIYLFVDDHHLCVCVCVMFETSWVTFGICCFGRSFYSSRMKATNIDSRGTRRRRRRL